MTIEELDEYKFLKSEIESLEFQISNLYNTYKSPRTDTVSQHGNEVLDRNTVFITRADMLRNHYIEKQNELLNKTIKIEKWLNGLDDCEIRSIVRWHYLLGLSWKSTSKKVYQNNSYYYARKVFYRFMGKEK